MSTLSVCQPELYNDFSLAHIGPSLEAVMGKVLYMVDSRFSPSGFRVTFHLMARPALERNHSFFVKTKY